MSIDTPQRWTRVRQDPEAFAAFEEFARAVEALSKQTLLESYRGTWATSTQYQAGQVVAYLGSSYLALKPSRGQTPASGSLYWVVLAEAGTSGSSGAASPPTTQTVLAGAVDSNGQASFLSAGSGLSVDLAATTTPVVVAFAAGITGAGLVTEIGRVTADDAAAWSGLTDATTNYLYIDRDGAGALTYGATTLPPIYALAEPTYFPLQQATGGTVLSGGDNAPNTSDRAFNHTKSQYWESSQTGTGAHNAAYIGYDFGASVTQQVTGFSIVWQQSLNTPTQVKAQWSSDGAAWTDISTLTVISNDFAPSQVYTLASYTAARYFRVLVTAGMTGANRVRVSLLTLMTLPDGAHWFDRSTMTMKARVASAWSTVQRVFAGEAVTAAGAVSSVITYALRGEYDSGWRESYTATFHTLQHNLGMSVSEGIGISTYFSRNATRLDEAPTFDATEVAASGVRWFNSTSETAQQNTRNALVYTLGAPHQQRAGGVYGNFRFQMKRSW
jgi:hypothetical protein